MGNDFYDWLCRWEPIECVGRHTKVYPAGFATGYQFRRPETERPFERRQRIFDRDLRMRSPVSRAIPVDGTVSDPPASWTRSPQVSFWMQKEKPGPLQRLLAWLKGEEPTF